MIKQPFNLFQPAKVTPQNLEHQGSTGGMTPNTTDVGQQAAAAEQQARQTQYVMPSQPVQQPNTTEAVPQRARQLPAIDPNSDTAGMDALSQMYTSPQDEERMRRASVANRRIMAVADALRHIGNIYNTVNYAPAQQLNSPVLEEQARYERGKALRDKANLTYLNYQQAKAAQDAKARQWEAEQGYKQGMLRHYQDQDRRLWERDAETALYHEGILGLRKEKQKLDDDYRNKRIGIDEYNARSRRITALAAQTRAGNSGRGGGGKGMDEYTTTTETTYNYDKLGKKTGSTTTKKRTVNGKQQPTQTTTKKRLPNTNADTESGKKRLPNT